MKSKENQAGMKSKLLENHTIIKELGWYVMRAIRESQNHIRIV